MLAMATVLRRYHISRLILSFFEDTMNVSGVSGKRKKQHCETILHTQRNQHPLVYLLVLAKRRERDRERETVEYFKEPKEGRRG